MTGQSEGTSSSNQNIVALADMALARRDLSILSVNLLLEGLRSGDTNLVAMSLRSLGVEDDSEMFSKMCAMIDALEDTMDEFRRDIGVGGNDGSPSINDAAHRLEGVIAQTFDAVNTTLDISEKQLDIFQNQLESVKRLRATANNENLTQREKDELLNKTLDVLENQIVDCQEMNLKILVTQSFQDLTGQVIKKVISLVTRVEDQLSNLSKAFGREPYEAIPDATRIYEMPVTQLQVDQILRAE